MSEKKLYDLFNSHFFKKPNNTGHEGLANYADSTLVPGGEDGEFYTHINYHTMYQSLLELIKNEKDKYFFVETGCAAHGTKSTLLWDKFVNLFDGIVYSVDLDSKAVNITQRQVSKKTNVFCMNSLELLPQIDEQIDFLYLDSYDVDFLDPKPSAEHHLKEFNLIKHLLKPGSVVLIDDTPCSPEWLDGGVKSPIYEKLKKQFDPNMCGKGSLVNLELEKMGAKKIMHQYQTLWIIE